MEDAVAYGLVLAADISFVHPHLYVLLGVL